MDGFFNVYFYPGEVVVLTLNADSDKVVFPVISKIAGYSVLSTNNAKSISIMNKCCFIYFGFQNIIIPCFGFGWFFIGYFYGFSSLLNAIYY
jgi:hypothetical protein